ncbi:SVOPL, partial [Cervus elaphus hippelaphus]
MEIMLIAVVSPVIRCEWQLENWQVALVTTGDNLELLIFQTLAGARKRHKSEKILFISFLWGAYFSLLTSFSPSYIWFVFLRTMVGCGVSGHSQGLGISFAYYGVILASAELLERDLVCGSRSESEVAVTVGALEESQSPCYCHMFAPSDYRTMIISTVGEIALNPLNILGINFLGRRLSLSITMGCTALFFLLLNICTSSAGLIGFLFMLRALVAANFNTIYIYTAEVYPTMMRALGMGTSGSLCRIGAMVAPFISQ